MTERDNPHETKDKAEETGSESSPGVDQHESAPPPQNDNGAPSPVDGSDAEADPGEGAASEGESSEEGEDLDDDLFVSPDDEDVEVVDEEELSEASSVDESEDAVEAAREALSEVSEAGQESVAQQARRKLETLIESLDDKSARLDEVDQELSERDDRIAEKDERIEELEAELEGVRSEREQINEKLLRKAADLENYRRRAQREKEELKRYGIDDLAAELIPVIDNMERALEHVSEEDEGDPIVDGVQMVYRQFLGALKKHGVEGFDSVGEKFDPEQHEAIQQVETEEHDTGTVLEEYQKGYFLHDRLLRPALVTVAKRVEPREPEEEQPESEADVEGGEQTDTDEVGDADQLAGENTDVEEETDDNESPTTVEHSEAGSEDDGEQSDKENTAVDDSEAVDETDPDPDDEQQGAGGQAPDGEEGGESGEDKPQG